MISVKDTGATGDGTTDDAPAIQAAIDAARDSGDGVFIPPAPIRPGGIRGFYNCKAPLRLYERSHLTGAGMFLSELRFTAATDGLTLAETASMQSNIVVRDLFLRGNADVSASPAKTCGLRLTPMNWSHFENIWIQDFVDGIECDAASVGWVLTSFRNVRVVLTKFPNPANGYPRFGLTLKGVDRKPQGLDFEGVIYGQLSTIAKHYSGDGGRTEFDFDLRAGTRLWRASGIKVYLQSPRGVWSRQEQGSDYTLYHLDDGAPQLVPVGASNVDKSRFRVRFATPPQAGTENIRIVQNDPTLVRAINFDQGTGNRVVGQFGGAEVGVYLNDDSNIVEASYLQLCDIGVQLTAQASDSQITLAEVSHATVDQLVSRHPSAARVTLSPALSRQATSTEKTSDQVITGRAYTTVQIGSGDNLAYPCHLSVPREIAFEGSVQLAAASGARAAADVKLEKSADGGATWQMLAFERLDVRINGGPSISLPLRLWADDHQIVQRTAGKIPEMLYRVCASVVAGDSITFFGAASRACFLRVRDVNPA